MLVNVIINLTKVSSNSIKNHIKLDLYSEKVIKVDVH